MKVKSNFFIDSPKIQSISSYQKKKGLEEPPFAKELPVSSSSLSVNYEKAQAIKKVLDMLFRPLEGQEEDPFVEQVKQTDAYAKIVDLTLSCERTFQKIEGLKESSDQKNLTKLSHYQKLLESYVRKLHAHIKEIVLFIYKNQPKKE